MKLSEYLEVQRSFYNKIDASDKRTELAKTKDYILSMIAESTELLECLDWKVHRLQAESKKHNSAEEMADIFKYFLNIMIALGIDEYKFDREFLDKSRVVEQRFKQEQALRQLHGKDIVVVDVDDVLCDFDRSMEQAYNQHHETSLALNEIVQRPDFAGFQLEYRTKGLKEGAVAVPGAGAFTRGLHGLGYMVLIMSSRPQHIYSGIYSSTLKWLEKEGIYFDALLFCSDKVQAVAKYVPSVRAVIDDDERVLRPLAAIVDRVYLVKKGQHDFNGILSDMGEAICMGKKE